jgi:hypothetical protein
MFEDVYAAMPARLGDQLHELRLEAVEAEADTTILRLHDGDCRAAG